MAVSLHSSWLAHLEAEFEQEYFNHLRQTLLAEKRAGKTIYPPGGRIFAALDYTPFHEVCVVILGQDPYHGAGQANGLCFSVNKGIKPPPSLLNIYKELETDLGLKPDITNGNLEPWAHRGVLLLNAVLTVKANEPASHSGIGWQRFTDRLITLLSEQREHLVFMLWGRYAQSKRELINAEKHLVLQAAHPSPFSAHSGFFGCRHFSQANQWLTNWGMQPVDWSL